MSIRFTPIPTDIVQAYRAGALDANGQPPERHVSDGDSNPCRHCLCFVPNGAGMLVLAHRPFATLHPYAEVGPIFLCADDCPAGGGADLPAIATSPAYAMRGYGPDDRIVYGTGAIVPTADLMSAAADLLEDPRIAYLHVRSARNTCYQLRVDRG